jgi:hypothetical protein
MALPESLFQARTVFMAQAMPQEQRQFRPGGDRPAGRYESQASPVNHRRFALAATKDVGPFCRTLHYRFAIIYNPVPPQSTEVKEYMQNVQREGMPESYF